MAYWVGVKNSHTQECLARKLVLSRNRPRSKGRSVIPAPLRVLAILAPCQWVQNPVASETLLRVDLAVLLIPEPS